MLGILGARPAEYSGFRVSAKDRKGLGLKVRNAGLRVLGFGVLAYGSSGLCNKGYERGSTKALLRPGG